tara:strand:+ start:13451 stop:14998 length:1548 start_codon:yes stop_codon:yes gene_type:complete
MTVKNSSISKLNSSQQNIFTASKLIGQMTMNTFGPFGMEKLTINNYGDAFVLRDGKSILEKADFDHPVAKILSDVSDTMAKNVGDGTISAILLTSFLLEQARINLEKGVHPNVIIDGYNQSLDFSISLLDSIKLLIQDKNQWKNLIYSSLSSKFARLESEKISQLVVDSINNIDPSFSDSKTIDYINVLSHGGDSTLNSKLVDGIIFDGDPLSKSEHLPLTDIKLAIILSPLSISNEGIKKEITINDPTLLNEFKKTEKQILTDNLKPLIDNGINVLFSHKTIDDSLISKLDSLGILTVKRVPLKSLEQIERSTGCLIVNHSDEISKKTIGHCSNLTTMKMYDKNWFVLDHGSKHKSNTILIRTETQRYSDLYEDIIHRILAMIRVSLINPYIVYGSGWFEFILSNQLRSFALNNNSLSQLAIHSYSNAIELLPISLGLNAGFNNVDLLVSLRNSQPSIDKYVHLDYSNRKLSNRRKPQIIESAFMKRQLLITATEAATSILRIDDIQETKTQNK